MDLFETVTARAVPSVHHASTLTRVEDEKLLVVVCGLYNGLCRGEIWHERLTGFLLAAHPKPRVRPRPPPWCSSPAQRGRGGGDWIQGADIPTLFPRSMELMTLMDRSGSTLPII